MKESTYKQIACISESNAEIFQDKANNILATIAEPEIVLDGTRPFTMYILYSIRKDVPETVLELLEMLDADGGHAHCEDCPAFIKSPDRRRKWGGCRRKPDKPTRCDSRACELYYLERRREAERITEEFEQIPYRAI